VVFWLIGKLDCERQLYVLFLNLNVGYYLDVFMPKIIRFNGFVGLDCVNGWYCWFRCYIC